MARRKRFLDDGSSNDSEEDEDDFEDNPEDAYQRGKRRRRGKGKDDATYGIFADDSEEEDPRAGRRADIAK